MVQGFAKKLSTPHYEMLHDGSGISSEIMSERQYRTVTDKSELEALGFSKMQQRAGLLMPMYGPDGSEAGYQLRPDNPRKNRQGKALKYENPKGASIHIDCPPVCQPSLANPSIPLWVTEGIKKADALASHGLCAIDLIGVWGFKSKNVFGGVTVSADLDYIALEGRVVNVVFDSDVMTKPEVNAALARFSEHLKRKKAKINLIYLPDENDGKTGVDDYLLKHSVDDLQALTSKELAPEESPLPNGGKRIGDTHFFELKGRFGEMITTRDGPVPAWLTNFTAQATKEVLLDDGIDQALHISLTGKLQSGRALPEAVIPAASVHNLSWIANKWGYGPIITSTVKGANDRVREILQIKSTEKGLSRSTIYSHTGWREIEGVWRYLMPNGALMTDDIDVQLDSPYVRYSLPPKPEGVEDAVRASLGFLDVAEDSITIPMLTMAYLAPLQSILRPSFSMWIRASSGSFKSTVTALLMSHFGDFEFNTPPSTWESTARGIERYLFDLKDCLAWIDDFNPRQSDRDMSNQHTKADTVLRSLGNLGGRSRMKADLTAQKSFAPRAIVISTGEIYPSGESVNARTMAIDFAKTDVHLDRLTEAQSQAHMYQHAMGAYLMWLSKQYRELPDILNETFVESRAKATAILKGDAHARMVATVASLDVAMSMFCSFAVDSGAATAKEMENLQDRAFNTFIAVAQQQTTRLNAEGPVELFINTLVTLYTQMKIMFCLKDESPKFIRQGVDLLGWFDSDYLYLDPSASYNRVSRFFRDEGKTFPTSQLALRQALFEKGILEREDNKHLTSRATINGKVERCLKLNLEKLPFHHDLLEEKHLADKGQKKMKLH